MAEGLARIIQNNFSKVVTRITKVSSTHEGTVGRSHLDEEYKLTNQILLFFLAQGHGKTSIHGILEDFFRAVCLRVLNFSQTFSFLISPTHTCAQSHTHVPTHTHPRKHNWLLTLINTHADSPAQKRHPSHMHTSGHTHTHFLPLSEFV